LIWLGYKKNKNHIEYNLIHVQPLSVSLKRGKKDARGRRATTTLTLRIQNKFKFIQSRVINSLRYMVFEYECQSIFRLGKSNLASEYGTTPSEYDFIKNSVDYCFDQWECSYI
jgi:hypothetical protein